MSASMRKLQKGDLLEVTVEKLVPGGEGLGKIAGYPIFVPSGLPGDRGAVQMISIKKDYARGLMIKRFEDAPGRVVPPCPLTESCGGCQWQHYDYAEQIVSKRDLLIETLSRIGKFSETEMQALVQPCIGMEDPWHYRNKGQFPFQMIAGQAKGGFFAPRSHDLVPIDHCLIHPEGINQALNAVEDALNRLEIPAYDETIGKGFLRHLIVRQAYSSQKLLIGLVSHYWEHTDLPKLVEALKEALPDLVGIVQNRNKEPGNRILGRETRVLWGEEALEEELDGLKFKISLPSFFQVNPQQTISLYNTVRNLAQLKGGEKVVDAFAGAGTIGMWLAASVEKVYCLETAPAAIADGKANQALNQIENIEFIEGDVEKILPKLIEREKMDLVIIDPPRKGCEPAVLATIIRSEAPSVIYVSCNPATLARDLALMTDYYELEAIQPVDLFPHTFHLETVVKLKRKV
jgi:23S rRNA (uracil1939-C5)-methyltransferase